MNRSFGHVTLIMANHSSLFSNFVLCLAYYLIGLTTKHPHWAVVMLESIPMFDAGEVET